LKLSIAEIASVVNGKITEKTDGNRTITSIFTDSREAEQNKGGLFAALKGERTDAHRFVEEVVGKGCCALIENDSYFTDNTILVANTTDALQTLAAWYRKEKLKITKIIAITGSVGKTSTKDMVALALGAGLRTAKTIGNRNSQIGLPITILETEPETEAAVFELGMSEFGEMARLSRVTSPDIVVITNIGYSHIENLGSRENICAEKLTIADCLSPDGVMILNGDEPLLKNPNKYGQKKIYCSVKNKNDSFAYDIIEQSGQLCFTADILGNSVAVTIPALGLHNVFNALFALTTAALCGVDLEKAAQALRYFETSGLRQKIYEKDGYTVIADCYNASPESMAAALSVLAGYKGRKIAVLGDMLELGSFAEELHEKVGEEVLGNGVDILITLGSLAKSFAKPVQGKADIYSFEEGEYEKAATLLKSILTPGDAVLYKASNRMQLHKIIEMI
jgi:UDP-N-acetylmuramoyl-tripeptide--D-alanyl-D-alanine ligase